MDTRVRDNNLDSISVFEPAQTPTTRSNVSHVLTTSPAGPSLSTRIIINRDSHTDDNDSARSVSRQSDNSSVSNVTFPHLKRKQKQYSINGSRLNPAAQLDPTKPLHTRTISQASQQFDTDSPTSRARSLLRVTGLARSNTAPSPKRRPPASHSSYGIETASGPPPSFTTRTLSQERVWKVDRSQSLRTTSDRLVEQDLTLKDTSEQVGLQLRDLTSIGSLLSDSSPGTADTQSVPTPTDEANLDTMDHLNAAGLGLSGGEADSKSGSESQRSEDLFLTIAKSDHNRPSSSRGDRRRSRISLPFFSSNRPSTATSTLHSQHEYSEHTPRAEVSQYFSKRSSLGQHVLENNVRTHNSERTLEPVPDQDSVVDSGSSYGGRRSSAFYYDSNRSTLRAQPPRSAHGESDSGYAENKKVGDHNATESTTSTTAPSTVWDELDDLKSRIRKLELTGKLPSSSAAAMSTAERPRTATTAATTMSGSPRQAKPPQTAPSTIEGVSSNVHPLLHEALGNAKTVLSQDLYQKLQATASDALQLASMMSSDTQSMRSGGPGVGMSERQLRRRTESMCRSLTELAIAMASEYRPAQTSTRPPSRDLHSTQTITVRNRRHSQNADFLDRPPVTSRVQSRLEGRRASAHVNLYQPGKVSPDLDSPTALPQYPGSGTRATRISSTGLRSRRTYIDGPQETGDDSPSVRPVSRAMTDVAARRSSRDHSNFSREYTSQYPLPSKVVSPESNNSVRTPLPSHLNTNFTTRRKYASPNNVQDIASSPLTPRDNWGSITIVQQDSDRRNSEVPSSPLEVPTPRSVSTRRSFGLASRIGSSVGSRLRAVKTERDQARASQHNMPQTGTVLDDRAREEASFAR